MSSGANSANLLLTIYKLQPALNSSLTQKFMALFSYKLRMRCVFLVGFVLKEDAFHVRILHFGICASFRLLSLRYAGDAMRREILDRADIMLLKIFFDFLLIYVLKEQK